MNLPLALRRSFAALCLLPGVLAAAQKPAAKETLRTPVAMTEVGLLDGAAYRIDVPPDWNKSLIIYYHGYQEVTASFHIAEKLNAQLQPFLQRHYAIAQSAYSQSGWALQQAYPETEALRKYFVKAYQQPVETYVVGHSMGGALVMVTLEINPKPYLGGLDLCGAVGPTNDAFQRRFAWRSAFDFYFPGVMPTLVPVPANYQESQQLRDKAVAAMKADPTAAAAMRSLTGLHTDGEVARDMGYFTYVVGDLQRRAGGNPFDNRNYLYTGTTPGSSAGDYALNDGVRRYAADPRAREYLVRHYTPSGRLGRPMLALHTLYDPLVPPTSLSIYAHMVEEAGAADNLVQKYVKRDGHCTFSADEVGRAFDELVEWTHRGQRPQAGQLR